MFRVRARYFNMVFILRRKKTRRSGLIDTCYRATAEAFRLRTRRRVLPSAPARIQRRLAD